MSALVRPSMLLSTRSRASLRDKKLHDTAKAIEDLDTLLLALPQALSSAKSKTLATRAAAMTELSQALRLQICLDRPHEELVVTALQLVTMAKQVSVLTSTSRADQHARMTTLLAQRLAEDVHQRLRALSTPAPSATSPTPSTRD